MKKFIVAILALLYISTSTGATISIHYCMGKLAGWDIGTNSSNACGKCGMDEGESKDSGCCKDEHKFLKNDSDQKTATFCQLKNQTPEVLQTVFFLNSVQIYYSSTEHRINSHTPFRSCGIPVYIRNRTFLI